MTNFEPQILKIKNGKIVRIQDLSPKDANRLRAFYKQAALETTHTLIRKENVSSVSRLKKKIESAQCSPSEIFTGVHEEGKVVGSLHFKVTIPHHPWVKHVGEFGMIILKEYWNQGIGKELIAIMEKFACEIGVSRIEAKVRCNNERGIALYQHSGFKIEGVRKKGAFINEEFVDEYFIAKLL